MNALISNSVRAARIAQQYHAQQVRAQTRAYRDAERARKALDRAQAADAKERQRLYVESRLAGVEAQNAWLEEQVRELSEVLRGSLHNDSSINFKTMLVVPTFPTLELGDLSKNGAAPNRHSYMPLAPNWLLGWLPWVKNSYAKRCQQGEQAFLRALDGFQKIEQERLKAIEGKKYELEMKVQAIREEAERQNAEVRRFQAEFEAGEPEAIAFYFMLVLSRS